jgi:hypothetical protein
MAPPVSTKRPMEIISVVVTDAVGVLRQPAGEGQCRGNGERPGERAEPDPPWGADLVDGGGGSGRIHLFSVSLGEDGRLLGAPRP